ncbi:hypothetical protein OVA29_21670 [Exiguobacterium sp. SL14]|nr:hypothetical protein [Exiguobacterium sp. SL14]
MIYWIAPSFIFGFITYLCSIPKKRDDLWDIKIDTNKGDRFIDNVKEELRFWCAGAGKTESVIFKILKHFAFQNFGGIIYDFKKGELTEIAIPLFKERLKTIACFDPQIGSRINVIHPRYIRGEKDINQITIHSYG